MVATDEITASLSTAEEHVKDAQDAFHKGRYHDCVYHSASAAENAGNALILALGGRVPRTHCNADAIEFAAARLRPSWLEQDEFRRMVGHLRNLEAHVVKSRYPIKVKEGAFVPPNKYYTESMAREMLEKAVFIVNTVKHFLAMI
jgi:HEPN domain-containing protein